MTWEPLPACINCGRALRRTTEPPDPALWLHGGNGMCERCANRRQHGTRVPRFQRPAQPEGWLESANCRGVDPEVFYPYDGDHAGREEAKGICWACPVRKVCLEDQMAYEGIPGNGTRFGVFGGLSANERYNLARRRRRATA